MRTPKYRQHAGRDRAFVEWKNKRYYLPGRWNSVESQDAYRAFLRDHVHAHSARPAAAEPSTRPLTIMELVLAYLEFAEGHYPAGKRSEYGNVRLASDHVLRAFPSIPAASFGPLALKHVRTAMVADGQSRGYVNSLVGRIKRMFKWAVAEELVPPATYQALAAVDGLKAGRTEARETAPRQPVDLAHVDAVLPFVSATVAGMIRFQWLTGARSGSVCKTAAAQFDKETSPWLWRPRHKRERLGQTLVVPVGPQAQAVLAPFLEAAESPEAFLFNPRAVRKNKRYRTRYTAGSYCVAVQRGIARANAARAKLGEPPIPKWSPHQIRHSRGTIVRAKYGIEAAQAALGHETMDATQIYAQRQLEEAKRVAREIG